MPICVTCVCDPVWPICNKLFETDAKSRVVIKAVRVDWEALIWRRRLSQGRPAVSTERSVVFVGRSRFHCFDGIDTRFEVELVAFHEHDCRHAQLTASRTMARPHCAGCPLDDKADSTATTASIDDHSFLIRQ